MKTYRDWLDALLDPTPNEVWRKAKIIDLGHELAGLRRDDYGNTIQQSAYGDRSSPYGWEIDHVIPKAMEGSSRIDNLRPLHWRANTSKSDKLPGLFGLAG